VSETPRTCRTNLTQVLLPAGNIVFPSCFTQRIGARQHRLREQALPYSHLFPASANSPCAPAPPLSNLLQPTWAS
jgi:hypothetical protein